MLAALSKYRETTRLLTAGRSVNSKANEEFLDSHTLVCFSLNPSFPIQAIQSIDTLHNSYHTVLKKDLVDHVHSQASWEGSLSDLIQN